MNIYIATGISPICWNEIVVTVAIKDYQVEGIIEL